jgi:hypothetical protein
MELTKLNTKNFKLNPFNGTTSNHRGVILFAMTLLMFLFFTATDEVRANNNGCPDPLPGQGPDNRWEPYFVPWPSDRMNYMNCRFVFTVCRRKLEQQPPNYPTVILYEYYISKIEIDDNIPGCTLDSVDLIFYYNKIVTAYIETFAFFLQSSANLVVGPCGVGDADIGHNIVRIGHPSCVTSPHYVRNSCPIQGIEPIRTITSCRSFDPHAICRSTYEYCYNTQGILTLIPKVDGSSTITCPPSVTLTTDFTVYPPHPVTLPCHPVCNKQNPTITTIEEAITNSSITPNPTSGETTLSFTVLTSGNLDIKLVNVSGQELLEIHNAYIEAGEFTTNVAMSKFPTGVYYLRISHNGNVTMEKVIRN